MPNFPKWIDDLFLFLSLSYEGHFLDSNADEVVSVVKKTAWFSELQRFKPETIQEASKRVIRKHPSYPPTLGEFCAICEEVFQVKRIPEYHRLSAGEYEKNRVLISDEKEKKQNEEAKAKFQEMVARIRRGQNYMG